jgi:undecaprenyl-diphosphatase
MRSFVDSITRWDVDWLTTIFGLKGKKFLSSAIPWISHSGDGYYYPVIPFLLLLIDPDVCWKFTFAGCIAFTIELPLYKLLKNGIRRDRPCETLSGVNRRISSSDRYSFPSGHAAAAFVIATLLAYFVPYLSLPVFAWAIAVGFSRIYLGVHYPTDILAGLALGIISALSGLIITA